MIREPVLLFPGQSLLNANCLDPFKELAFFETLYRKVCDKAGLDFRDAFARGAFEELSRNKTHSLLVTLTNLAAFNSVKALGPFAATAGYSVGQYAALHAAGVIEEDILLDLVSKRAILMDEAMGNRKCGMFSVIGIPLATLQEFLRDINQCQTDPVVISNINCPGQYTLAGSEPMITDCLRKISRLKPKKIVPLPTSGAWHCYLLSKARPEFERYLKSLNWKEPICPVISNVTGARLPEAKSEFHQELSLHLSSPVQWEKGIRTLLSDGCQYFLEVGIGNTLSKFLFFISREAYCKTVTYPNDVELIEKDFKFLTRV